MKSLYLVEGKNDYNFLVNILVQNYSIDPAKIKHYSNEGNKKTKKIAESTTIRSFLEDYSPYDVLIKSERGKKSLISLLSKVCIPTAGGASELNLTTMLDHDGKCPDLEFKSILDEVKENRPQLDFNRTLDTPLNGIGHASSYRVLKVSGRKRVELNSVHFFCFYGSLEKVIRNKFGTSIEINEGIRKLAQSLDGILFLPQPLKYASLRAP